MATLARVIPLVRKEVGRTNPPLPEPTDLYCLVVIALFLHTPSYEGWCVTCGDAWPCEQMKQACFLIEAF